MDLDNWFMADLLVYKNNAAGILGGEEAVSMTQMY